jgi:glycosyltransferase involved in cell wall biosynthesis
MSMKVLEIGNYPPPMCGWAIQTVMLVDAIRARGHDCEVLKINEGRRERSPEYIDVQSGFDYLCKLVRFCVKGYRFHMHVNGSSKKGYLLALSAVVLGRIAGRPATLSFHGGVPQPYFPKPDSTLVWLAFRVLFDLSGDVLCDSAEIKRAIVGYGISAEKVADIPCFSSQCLDFQPAALDEDVNDFLSKHRPLIFSYVSFRPEYRLDVLRAAIALFAADYANVALILLGFPRKEMPSAQAYVESWHADERARTLLLGNLPHDAFLTLLCRCDVMLRTPSCDGVSASVLESLAFGVPVVASENGRRPVGVVTYTETDASDLAHKLKFVCERYEKVKEQTRLVSVDDNICRTADWLLGEIQSAAQLQTTDVQ